MSLLSYRNFAIPTHNVQKCGDLGVCVCVCVVLFFFFFLAFFLPCLNLKSKQLARSKAESLPKCAVWVSPV